VTALREAASSGDRSGVRSWLGLGAKARSTLTEDAPPVLDMDTGSAPWVAVPYAPGKPGAERFLEPVMVGGTLIGVAHGPDFVPYWLTDRAPALAPPVRRRPLTETRRRVLIAATVLLTLLLLLVTIVLLMLLGRSGSDPMPRQLPPTVFLPTPPPVPSTPYPEPSTSPSPPRSGEPTPGRSPGDQSPQEPEL
jgi:hypothetical protein